MMDEYTSTTYTGEDTGRLTLEKLMEATKRIRDMPPVAVRIYFVDRWEAFCKLRNMTEKTEVEQRAIMAMPTSGIPIVIADKESAMPPGIWAEMSDGTYKRLDKEQNA